MIIYVDASVIQTGNGTKENPFKTIQEAAAKALPGDEVIVAPGLYREAVNPIHAGTADKRITYRSAIKGQAHITGSEAVKDWENVEGTVWKAVIPNGIFGDYNPFTTLVSGDWFIATFIAHTGDVYLNEKSMYEVTTLDKVKNPQKSTISWDPDFSVYTWYAEQDEANNQTIIYANFHELLSGLPLPLIRREWSVLTGPKDGSSKTVKSMNPNAAVFLLVNICSLKMITNG